MKTISFIGGDSRTLFLYEMYKSDFEVYTYGLDYDDDYESCINRSDVIVLPIPFSVDNQNLYAPVSNKKISIEQIINDLNKKIIVCGNINNKYLEQ